MTLRSTSDYAHSMVTENKLLISYLITDESAKLPKLYAKHVVSYNMLSCMLILYIIFATFSVVYCQCNIKLD